MTEQSKEQRKVYNGNEAVEAIARMLKEVLREQQTQYKHCIKDNPIQLTNMIDQAVTNELIKLKPDWFTVFFSMIVLHENYVYNGITDYPKEDS